MRKKYFEYAIGSIGALTAAFFLTAAILNGRVMPGTEINGYDVSFRRREELQGLLEQQKRAGYQLVLRDIHGKTSMLTGEALGLSCRYPVEELPAQNPLLWGSYLFRTEKYQLTPELGFEETALRALLSAEGAPLSPDVKRTMPRDAFLTGYIPGEGYRVAPEIDGDTPEEELLYEAVAAAIRGDQSFLDLSEAGVYKRAERRREDPGLTAQAAELNEKTRARISHLFGQDKYTLNADTYIRWLLPLEDGSLSVDMPQAEAYILQLKEMTDTAGTTRDFRTEDGRLIELKGPYGYRLSEKPEGEQLSAEILSGSIVEREPVYSQAGASRVGSDYGSRYVEVDLGRQRVFYIENGEILLATDCVTGNVARGHSTPPGIYPITYKTTNATLRGEDYEAHVSYWMPFNRGIGLHDATWRGRFGGNIYRYSGSHGCINLPFSAASELYQKVEKGLPVICHY